MGKQVNKLVSATGLNNYLCRRVFLRLYDDAIQRIERRNQRIQRFKQEAQDDLYRVMGRSVGRIKHLQDDLRSFCRSLA